MGIPVLPLNDPGAFHGACWREGGRNIIILKQQTDSAARWLYDIIHELRHCAENPEIAEHLVIETNPISPDRQESDSEEEANEFAKDVILGGRSDELEQACVRLAGGSVEQLKWAVPKIAEKEGVEIDSLANHMAFRLSQQGINWWGAANNLQREKFSPWEHARRIFLQRIDLGALGEFDRGLLTRAVTDILEV
ncbi:MAG: hypothetical protein IH899_11655 [Planctomycetes bacterium]|nr:hypothetical protein [Planctomycetota bacterium]